MSQIKVRELIILVEVREVAVRLEDLDFGCLGLSLLLLHLLLVVEPLGLELQGLKVNATRLHHRWLERP